MFLLQSILGSESCEQVLVFLLAREQGYPMEISQFYGVSKMPIQKQMGNWRQTVYWSAAWSAGRGCTNSTPAITV